MRTLVTGLMCGVLAPRPARAANSGVQPAFRRRPRRLNHPLGIALALLLAASMWFYVKAVLIPYQEADAARYSRPRGNLSDLYPRWLGARELLLHHRDPYSRQVTREIQVGYYGRLLDPSRPSDPKDQQGFAYPVYVAFLLAPFLHLDFVPLRTGFTWVLAGLIVASVLLWAKALRWQLSPSGKAIFVLLVAGSFPAAQGIKLQQLTILVSAVLAAAAAALAAGWLSLAGLLLALSTIKPQLVVPLLIFLLLWVIGDWPRRWPLLASFGVAMACLLGASQWVLPGWIGEFMTALAAYRQYTGGVSILAALLTPVAGLMVTAALLLALLVLGWRLRHAPAGSPSFNLMVGLVLAVTVVIIPTWAPYNQLLLLPALILLVRDWRRLVRFGRLSRLLYLMVAVLVVWPWLATLYLSGTWFAQSAVIAQRGWTLPLYTSMFIPFGVMALLGIDAARREVALPAQ
ncbi:MAG TPA: glycosyltransferase 87 family protein [Terriglobales bacterium]|nr:glycosyltransferase 87 family protein [Terriglobales bacterium]